MSEKIKVNFLGTGGMIPDAERNHPSFLLTCGAENILVDCGEGTQTQFRKAKLNPCKITKILITHWHGDHTFGLPGLLRTLATSGYNKKLIIYGPQGFKKHMNEMFIAFGDIEEFQIKIEEVKGKFFENNDFYIEAETMIHVQPCNAYNIVLKGKKRLKKKEIKKLKIREPSLLKKLKQGKDIVLSGKKYSSKGLTFIEQGKKISFVMDTLMNGKIIPFVKDSDLLVCEATFTKSHERQAKSYKHLTSAQAGEIAKKAKVKKLFLVHLSQRYNKEYEQVLHEAKKYFKQTYLPKDLDSTEI